MNAELDALYESARLSVLHGVTWNGTPESTGGVSKDEALEDAAALIRQLGPVFAELERLRKIEAAAREWNRMWGGTHASARSADLADNLSRALQDGAQ